MAVYGRAVEYKLGRPQLGDDRNLDMVHRNETRSVILRCIVRLTWTIQIVHMHYITSLWRDSFSPNKIFNVVRHKANAYPKVGVSNTRICMRSYTEVRGDNI